MKNKRRMLKLLYLFVITLIIYITVGRMNNIPLSPPTIIPVQEKEIKIKIEDKIKELNAEFFDFDNPPKDIGKDYYMFGKIILKEGEIITSISIDDDNYFKFKTENPGYFHLDDEIGMIGKLSSFDKTQVIIVEEFGSKLEIQITPVFKPIWWEKYEPEGEGH